MILSSAGAAGYGGDDPIAALATPPGQSALAVIRTGGKGALGLLSRLFSRGERLASAPGNTVPHGWIIDPEREGPEAKVDEVMVAVYRAPRSYTGEDAAEISCHGGYAAVKAVLGVLKRGGFRDALRGEFTFRAFMNGKLDLTRAESVMELVAASTDLGRSHALRRLSGDLEEEVNGIKELLLSALAGVELRLDYAEDDGLPAEEAMPGRAEAEEAHVRLRALAESSRRERLYREGALAAFAGRPNAGKSSLFNCLLMEDRAIVTPAPGATRDWIEAAAAIEGIPLRLADTAGLREAGEAGDEAERMGIERSWSLIRRADLVLYVIDGEAGFGPWDRAFLPELRSRPCLLLWNKADIAPLPEEALPEEGRRELAASCPGIPFLPVSAKTGAGIPALCTAIARTLEQSAALPEESAGSPGLGTERQRELINLSLAALEEALSLARRGESLDLIAPSLREALDALGEITGEVSTADILESMFSRFCVGK